MEGDYFLLRQQNKHGLHGGGNNSSKVRWVVLGPRGWFLVPGGGSWTPGWFLDPGGGSWSPGPWTRTCRKKPRCSCCSLVLLLQIARN